MEALKYELKALEPDKKVLKLELKVFSKQNQTSFT